MKIKDIIIDLMFPPRCAICDDVLKLFKHHICDKCRDKVVYINEPYCLKCGKALSENKELCHDCKNRKHYFVKGVSIFDYGSIADSLYRFKNRSRAEYASFYAKEIYENKKDFINLVSPDYFVPVPIHKHKLSTRGYNQAELISKELTKLTGIPTNTGLIQRAKNTSPLKNMALSERQNNLNKAFNIGVNDVKLKTIIIIDDIYTTGSTIDEISKTIQSRFDCEIYFITVTVGRGC